MNRERSLIKNTIIIGFGTFLPKFASVITLPIATAYLTKLEYGTYDLLLTLVSLILPLATLQIQCAAFRFLVPIRDSEERCAIVISNIIWFTILMSIFTIMIVFFLIGNYGFLIRAIICCYFFFDIMLQTLHQIVRGLGKNAVYSVSTVLNSIINLLMIIVLVKILNLGLIGVLGSLVIANFIASVYLILKSRLICFISTDRLDFGVVKEMIVYSWPFIPNNLSSWIMTLSDRMILAFFCGFEVNAVYAIAKKIPNLLTAVQSTFSLAWQENASLSAEDKDIDVYYSTMFENIFNLVIGACACLIGVSPLLFCMLIRGDYSEAYHQMPILFLATTFATLSSYLAGIYVADKKTKEIGTTTTIAAIVNLTIDLIAVPIIGMWAASFSTLISYGFLFVYRIIDLNKYHNIRYKYAKIVLGIALLVLFCVLSLINNKWINYGLALSGIIIIVMLNKSILERMINKIIKDKNII